MQMRWRGVMPATTTAFAENLNIDHAFVAKHAKWLIDNGCTGIVTPGSLGESATLGATRAWIATGGMTVESGSQLNVTGGRVLTPS